VRRTTVLTALVLALSFLIETAEAARTVKASAKFTVELGDQSGTYDFGQRNAIAPEYAPLRI